jgi:hypothetical protein
MSIAPRFPLLSLPALLLVGACGGPDLPPLRIDPVTTVDLAIALGIDEPTVIGVTVDPVTGQRFVLDAGSGLYEVHTDGTADLVRALENFPAATVVPVSAWTDFVALGDGTFAITARNDGYRLDLEANTLTEYFCYVPDPGMDDPVQPVIEQLTESVTFDVHSELLFAQPVTFDLSGENGPVDEPIAASIGAYTLAGGQPVAWFEIPEADFLAGGSAVDSDGTLLLGRGNELHRFTAEGEGRLDGIGIIPSIGRIDGMTVDPQSGLLVIVDGENGLLLDLELPR